MFKPIVLMNYLSFDRKITTCVPLPKYKQIIKQKSKVTELGILGYYVRWEKTENSDLDVLIDYAEIPSFLDLVDFEFSLSDNLGITVDVFTKKR